MVAAQKIIGLVVALLIAGCAGTSGSRAAGPPIDLVFESIDGGDVVLSSYRGRVVVLHVFATWVPAAHTDADQLIRLHRERGNDVVVLGLALDPDGRRFVAPWRDAIGAPYVVGLASQNIRDGASALGPVREVPATLILDRRGRIARRIDRALADGELERVVAALLDR
jgi:peroxiredoxin